MLALIPLLALAGLWLLLGNLRPSWGWRRCLLRAALLWGGYAVLAVEGLSLVQGITQAGLALAWAVPLVASAAWLARQATRTGHLAWPRFSLPGSWTDRGLWLAVLAIVGVTALIAWLAPPQTWDSLNYHLSRVAHWAQDRSLRPFATGIEVQNSRSPGAELLVLQLYVLAGGDRLANLVEWFAMVGSLVAAGVIAGQLGGERLARLLAVVLTITVPMGIAQASSTMTDYVVAFWVMAAIAECLVLLEQGTAPGAVFYAGLAAGLALVTKPTAAAYLLPFALWVGYVLLQRQGFRRFVGQGLAALALVAVLNAGPLIRNTEIYGTPLDPAQVAVHSNQVRDPRGLLSNLLRNLALNAGTPSTHVNKAIYLAVLQVHDWIGLDPNDPRTTSAGEFKVRVPNMHEDLVSNPVHAWLYLIVVGALLLRRRVVGRPLVWYGLAAAGTFVLLSWIFKWQIFGGRYQLPFFVLFAPLAAVAIELLLPARWARVLGMVVVVAALPWLVGIRSRPLIPPRTDPVVGSVLVEPRQTLTFANAPYLLDTLTTVGGLVRQADCSTVGIALSGNAPEYLLWVVMGAPRPDLRMGWIVDGTPSARYADPDFAPCAVVCDESCPADWTTIRGLPLAYERAGYRLYLSGPPGG